MTRDAAFVRVAEKLGMRVDREVDHHALRHRVYRIDRDDATIAS